MKFKLKVTDRMSEKMKISVDIDTESVRSSVNNFETSVKQIPDGKWEIEDMEDITSKDGKSLDIEWNVIKEIIKEMNNNDLTTVLITLQELEERFDGILDIDIVLNTVDKQEGFYYSVIQPLIDSSFVLNSPDGKSLKGRPKEFVDSFIEEIYGSFETFFDETKHVIQNYLDGKCVMKRWGKYDSEEDIRRYLDLDANESIPEDIFDFVNPENLFDDFNSQFIDDIQTNCFDFNEFFDDLEKNHIIYYFEEKSIIIMH